MTFTEAENIFKSWKEYVNFANKLSQIFSKIPESFLPYPLEVLEEALNVVAKKHFDNGDTEMAKNIQLTMAAFLFSHTNDEEAIISMNQSLELILKNPELKNTSLENLRACGKSAESNF
jgi:hypothetical protein